MGWTPVENYDPPKNAIDNVAFFVAHEVLGPDRGPTLGMYDYARRLLVNLARDGYVIIGSDQMDDDAS